MESRRNFVRRCHGCRGGGRGRVRKVSFSVPTFGGRSMTVIADEENRGNVKVEVIVSTETDDVETVPLGSHSMLKQESVLRSYQHPYEPWFIMRYAQPEGSEVVGDMSVGENSSNEEFE